jgi:hypothetical protein
MFIRVTYRYTTDSAATGTLTGVMSSDPKRVIKEAETARRKHQMIRMMDPTKGIAHAFPADRLIDIEIEPFTGSEETAT